VTNPQFDAALLDEYLEELDREYLSDLLRLQVELLELQRHIRETKQRVVILFEGRDTAGKGGAILRFTQHLNPRHLRIVALGKPTPVEAGEWYFQRYVRLLPTGGEIVFFDRSWYNRAVVEPVMSFCTAQQHEAFMGQVNQVEHMLVDDGIRIIKFWFSIDAEEQLRRLGNRAANPLKAWKLSPVDLAANEHWEEFSRYKQAMFERTSTPQSPWIVVRGNEKKVARREAIRHVLTTLDYPRRGFSGVRTTPDPTIVQAFVPGTRHDPEAPLERDPSR